MRRPTPLPRQDLELVAELTRALWDDLRGQRVFITGGTGFFGCWLVESFCFINRLLALNAHATILTRNPGAFAQRCPYVASDTAITLHQGDVRSFAFPNGEYRYVIHAATDTGATFAAEAPMAMLSTIIAGTERTLKFAATHGTTNFLLTSSGAVYGKQPTDLTHIPETYIRAPDAMDPLSVYGEGKRTAELLCEVYQNAGQLDCKIARCWSFCGPHLPLDQHFAIGNFIGDVLAGRPILIQGDGTPRRSYLYAADLAVWLWTILFQAPGLVPFNVGSAHDVSILELAQTITATLNSRTEIHVGQKATPGAAPLRYVPSVDRARELLGLHQTVGLEESVRRTAIWHTQ